MVSNAFDMMYVFKIKKKKTVPSKIYHIANTKSILRLEIGGQKSVDLDEPAYYGQLVILKRVYFILFSIREVDGKIIIGEIKEKEIARQQYDAARRRGESAGYIGTK